MPLSLAQLTDAVGASAGLRARTDLEPLGGAGDKLFPPTYSVPDSAETKYAVEDRRVDGPDGPRTERSVVLDSVASQANRMEEAILSAIRSGALDAPVTSVDFGANGLPDLDRVSDWEAPHRIFDATLRDSFDGDELFRTGAVGRSITEATSRNAAALAHHSPHTLLFGGWDSTGPKGGRGAKYERALTSEIVALDVRTGVKTASRVDPLRVERAAGTIYQSATDVGWTLDEREADRDGAKAKVYDRQGKGDVGRPSQLNHGNVTPSIDAQAGGVTAGSVVATTVLSFIQLRRLRFPTLPDGTAVDPGRRAAVERAAHTALAALGIAAAVLTFDAGFDLRSRCVLVPIRPLRLELLAGGGERSEVEMSASDALALLAEATQAARDAGLGWRAGERTLRPSPRLVDLVRRSQDVAVHAPAGAGA